MKVYVINLKKRTDRWQHVLNEKDKVGLDLCRVDAVSSDAIESIEAAYASSSVVAIWKSHQKAMSEFLKTNDDFAIILEDDFKLKANIKSILDDILFSKDIDFIQFGYLYTSPMQFLSVKTMNLINIFLRFINRATHLRILRSLKFTDKKLIHENHNLPFNLVPYDIRAGAHAYLVSQKFAQSMQLLNSPPCLSTDGLYMALSWNRAFKMYRTRMNFVRQSNSQSSVESRTIN